MDIISITLHIRTVLRCNYSKSLYFDRLWAPTQGGPMAGLGHTTTFPHLQSTPTLTLTTSSIPLLSSSPSEHPNLGSVWMRSSIFQYIWYSRLRIRSISSAFPRVPPFQRPLRQNPNREGSKWHYYAVKNGLEGNDVYWLWHQAHPYCWDHSTQYFLPGSFCKGFIVTIKQAWDLSC